MEEIVTIDGRQFKLTLDRPLTASEKQQVIADIRKQTGCGTCGSRSTQATLSTGGVYSLPFGNGGAGDGTGLGVKHSTDTVNLKASPAGGVRPYTVRFWYSLDAVAISQVGTTHTTLSTDAEGMDVTDSYVLTDDDVAGALGNLTATAREPTNVNTSDGTIDTTGGTVAHLSAGSIRFYASVVDSCTGADGAGTCAQYVDVATTCIAPTCSFVVT